MIIREIIELNYFAKYAPQSKINNKNNNNTNNKRLLLGLLDYSFTRERTLDSNRAWL